MTHEVVQTRAAFVAREEIEDDLLHLVSTLNNPTQHLATETEHLGAIRETETIPPNAESWSMYDSLALNKAQTVRWYRNRDPKNPEQFVFTTPKEEGRPVPISVFHESVRVPAVIALLKHLIKNNHSTESKPLSLKVIPGGIHLTDLYTDPALLEKKRLPGYRQETFNSDRYLPLEVVHQQLSLPEVRDICCALAEITQEWWEYSQFIHGDLSPRNILIGYVKKNNKLHLRYQQINDKRVPDLVVIDYETGRFRRTAPQKISDVFYSADVAPPEYGILHSNEIALGVESEQYSIASLFFLAMANQSPHVNQADASTLSDEEIIATKHAGELKNLRQAISAAVPTGSGVGLANLRDIQTVFTRALAPSPSDRFEDNRKFAEQLRKVLTW